MLKLNISIISNGDEKMKKIFILSFLVLVISAGTPLLVLGNGETRDKNAETEVSSQTTASKAYTQLKNENTAATVDEDSNGKKRLTAGHALEYLNDNSPLELKLAVIEICKNNYRYNELHSLAQESDTSNLNESLYNELLNLYDKTSLSFSQGGKTRFIPLVKSGHLHSATDDEYPYMASVATPWEAESPDFEYDKSVKCGLSITSLKYLIDAGCSRREALGYLLPEFDIN